VGLAHRIQGELLMLEIEVAESTVSGLTWSGAPTTISRSEEFFHLEETKKALICESAGFLPSTTAIIKTSGFSLTRQQPD